MTRTEALAELIGEPHYRKVVGRLRPGELEWAFQFCAEFDHLGHLEFERQANAAMLKGARSKNWAIQVEILFAANHRARGLKFSSIKRK